MIGKQIFIVLEIHVLVEPLDFNVIIFKIGSLDFKKSKVYLLMMISNIGDQR